MPYIFRPPAAAVGFSWKLEDVLAWLAPARNQLGLYGARERKLGTTVTVRSFVHPDKETYVRVTLYDTDIARIYEDRVEVGAVDSEQRQATRWWIEQILYSNCGYGVVFSRDFAYYVRKSYGRDGSVDIPINNVTFRRTER